MGITTGFPLMDMQGCSWLTRPEGQQESEGQDLGPYSQGLSRG